MRSRDHGIGEVGGVYVKKARRERELVETIRETSVGRKVDKESVGRRLRGVGHLDPLLPSHLYNFHLARDNWE